MGGVVWKPGLLRITGSNLVHLVKEKQTRGNEKPDEGPLQICESKLAGTALGDGRRTKESRSAHLGHKFPQNAQCKDGSTVIPVQCVHSPYLRRGLYCTSVY